MRRYIPDIRRALRAGAAAEATKRSGPPPPPPDLHKEQRDGRAVNEVIVQFLAGPYNRSLFSQLASSPFQLNLQSSPFHMSCP